MKESRHVSDEAIVFAGREIISHWMSLLRAIRLYESGNEAIYAIAEKILERIREVVRVSGGDFHLAIRQDSIFVVGERIREGAIGSSLYHGFVDILRKAGLRGLRVDEEAGAPEIDLLTRLLIELSQGERSLEQAQHELSVRGANNVEFEAEVEEEEVAEELDQEKVAKHIYLRSIGVVKGVFDSMRKTDRMSARRVKRVVQQMIESLDFNPENLVNLTSLKNYDEYTFNHSVNVSVLAIALARHVGLSRRQLYLVGQAGMLHDLGKLCLPKELLNKPGKLTGEEWETVKGHPVDGFVSVARSLGVTRETVDVALVAFEHHKNLDGSGYPTQAGKEGLGLLSRIVSVVDRYDAMTSARVYRSAPLSPPKTLAIMHHSKYHDGAILRYFMNMMGFYPLGTVVRLSDDTVGVVVGCTPDPELRHFPMVKPLINHDGNASSGAVIDLAAGAKDSEPLRVEETLEASEHSIEMMDYLL